MTPEDFQKPEFRHKPEHFHPCIYHIAYIGLTLNSFYLHGFGELETGALYIIHFCNRQKDAVLFHNQHHYRRRHHHQILWVKLHQNSYCQWICISQLIMHSVHCKSAILYSYFYHTSSRAGPVMIMIVIVSDRMFVLILNQFCKKKEMYSLLKN